jgi:quercetin dioxygenase-like cupin family protein
LTIRQYSFVVLIVVVASSLVRMPRLAAQGTEGKPIVGQASTAKFSPIPNAPECFTVAVERGDPSKGPSVILAKFAPGCVAPFHWHTPSETVMIVSGSLQAQMKDDKAFVAHRGDFVYMPPRHVHRAACLSSTPCLVFLTSDAAFDIHWVDQSGQEISLEAAMKSAKAARAPRVAKP